MNPELDQELEELSREMAEEMSKETSTSGADRDNTVDKFYSIAKYICEGKTGENYIYSTQEHKYYHFKNGYWQHIYDNELIKLLAKSPIELINKGKTERFVITKFPLIVQKKIVENIQIINDLRLINFNCYNFINLNNCMFDPISKESIAHHKGYFSTIRVPYNYLPEAKCPLWIKTLTEIFENDQNKLSIFQEFVGYCLTQDNNQKKALLLLGESDSGKSTILFLVKDLIGHQNCSHVPLQCITNPQNTPQLINKLVNIDADVGKNAADFEGEFKKITSGEEINCNQKFVATFSFIPKCKMIMAANKFPKITDHSSAFYNRLIVIPCDRIFLLKDQDKELPEKLRKELPGILNWAVEGLDRFKARGCFEVHTFMKDAIKELEDENNPSNVFFEEHVEVDMSDDVYITKGELFSKYKFWCETNKQYVLSNVMFGVAVAKTFAKATPKKARIFNGPHIWKHLRWVAVKNNNPEPIKETPAPVSPVVPVSPVSDDPFGNEEENL